MDAVIVVLNGVKNIATFAISYAIVSWNILASFTIPFVVLGVLLIVAHILALFLYFAGARLRRWQADKFVTGCSKYHGESF